MNRFWMIWNEGNRGPVVKHHSETTARIEAERLARGNPGKKFYVLLAVDCCRINDVMWACENEVPW